MRQFPQTWCQAIDNIPSPLHCATRWPSSHLAGGAQPLASIFHASPASITGPPAPVSAPRGQVFRENTLQALARSHHPRWSVYKAPRAFVIHRTQSPHFADGVTEAQSGALICSELVTKLEYSPLSFIYPFINSSVKHLGSLLGTKALLVTGHTRMTNTWSLTSRGSHSNEETHITPVQYSNCTNLCGGNRKEPRGLLCGVLEGK